MKADIDPFVVRRVANGWLLTQLDESPEGTGYETVYQDDPRQALPDVESLVRCLLQAVNPMTQDEDEGGIAIHYMDKGRGNFDC